MNNKSLKIISYSTDRIITASSEDVGSGRRVLLSTTVSKNTAANHRITITGGKVLLLLFVIISYHTIYTS